MRVYIKNKNTAQYLQQVGEPEGEHYPAVWVDGTEEATDFKTLKAANDVIDTHVSLGEIERG